MVANAEAMQGLDYGQLIGAEAEAAPRQRGLSRQMMLGLGLIVLGLVALIVTWAQIRDIQNIAAQIPYVASGGLLGVALAVIGGTALFAGSKPAAAEATTTEELAAQVRELSVQVKWTQDAVEQIADYLNELAQSGVDTSTRRR